MERLAFNSSAAITEMRLARQVLANEMSNMTTTGFKRSFEVSMKAFKAGGEGFDSSYQPQAAHMDFIQLKPGPLIATGRDLDIHMNEHTVLGVQAPNGETAFTRRGDLQLSIAGVLQTGNGHPVMGDGNTPITIPPNLKVSISDDGGVYVTNPAQPGVQNAELVGTLMLRDASATPLLRREDGLFRNGAGDGQDITPGPEKPGLTPGALEGSAVNAMNIMVKLIDQSRSFEQAINMIKEAKTTDEAGASMLKGS